MKQIKIFSEIEGITGKPIEERVNAFLSKLNSENKEVVDVKFQFSGAGANQTIVMIIYNA